MKACTDVLYLLFPMALTAARNYGVCWCCVAADDDILAPKEPQCITPLAKGSL